MATNKKTPKKAAKPAAPKAASAPQAPKRAAPPNKWINRILGLSALSGIFVFVGLYNWEIGLLLLGLMTTVGGFAFILRNASTLVPAEAVSGEGARAASDNIFERFRSQHQLPPTKERQASPPPQAKPLQEVPAEPLEDDDPLGAALKSKSTPAPPEPADASPFDEMLGSLDEAPPAPEPPAAEPAPVAPKPVAATPRPEPKPTAAETQPEPKPIAAAPEPEPTVGEPEPAPPEPAPEPPTRPLNATTQPVPPSQPVAASPEPEPASARAEEKPTAAPEPPPVVPELVELSEDDLFGDDDDDDLFADARFTLPAEEPSRLPETTPPMPSGPVQPEPPRPSNSKARTREERLEDAESLLKSAKRAFQAQQLDEARINLESYRSLLKRLRAQPSAEALELQTQISLMQGDTQQAQASLGEIRSGSEASKQAESLKLMEDLAASLEKKQAYKEVQPILRELLEVYEGQKRWREADQVCDRLTQALEALGAEEELMTLLKQQRGIKQTLQDRPGESRLLDRLGTLSHQRGDLEATRKYYEENLKLRAERV